MARSKNYPKRTYRGKVFSKSTSRRRSIKRWAGEKPSIVDRIAKGVGTVAKVARTVSTIAQMVNCEKKWYDKATSLFNITNTGGDIALYTNVPQGLDDTHRNGNVIKGQSLFGRYTIQSNSLYPTMVRLLWVLDKEYNGSTPPISSVLQNVDTLSGMNMDETKRFVILKDKFHVINPNGNQTTPQTLIRGKFYFPTDFHIHYKGTDDTQASCKENQIILYAVSNQPSASAPVMTHYGRFKFFDN